MSREQTLLNTIDKRRGKMIGHLIQTDSFLRLGILEAKMEGEEEEETQQHESSQGKRCCRVSKCQGDVS